MQTFIVSWLLQLFLKHGALASDTNNNDGYDGPEHNTCISVPHYGCNCSLVSILGLFIYTKEPAIKVLASSLINFHYSHCHQLSFFLSLSYLHEPLTLWLWS